MRKINGVEELIDNFKWELEKCLESEITKQIEQRNKQVVKKEDLYKYFIELGYEIEEKQAMKCVFIRDKSNPKRFIRISLNANDIRFNNYDLISISKESLNKLYKLMEVLNDK